VRLLDQRPADRSERLDATPGAGGIDRQRGTLQVAAAAVVGTLLGVRRNWLQIDSPSRFV
jgi:hypothetical protein